MEYACLLDMIKSVLEFLFLFNGFGLLTKKQMFNNKAGNVGTETMQIEKHSRSVC